MNEEWGPWIQHNGKSCPCVGKLVKVLLHSGEQLQAIAGADCIKHGIDPNSDIASAWIWFSKLPQSDEIVSYCIKKPKSLIELFPMLEKLPKEENA